MTYLYWAFLARHEALLKAIPRLSMPMASLRKRGISQKKKDQAIYRKVSEILQMGNQVTPQDMS